MKIIIKNYNHYKVTRSFECQSVYFRIPTFFLYVFRQKSPFILIYRYIQYDKLSATSEAIQEHYEPRCLKPVL